MTRRAVAGSVSASRLAAEDPASFEETRQLESALLPDEHPTRVLDWYVGRVLALEVQKVIVHGDVRGDGLRGVKIVVALRATRQSLLPAGGELPAAVAQAFHNLSCRGGDLLFRREPTGLNFLDGRRDALQQPVDDALQDLPLGGQRLFDASGEVPVQPLVDAVEPRGGIPRFPRPPLLRRREQRLQGGFEPGGAPADGAVTRRQLHRAVAQGGDADDRVRFMSGVSNQVEEAAPGYRRLRYRPGVTEVPPDVAQGVVRVVVPKTGVDKLKVGSDGLPQRRRPRRMGGGVKARGGQPALQLGAVGDQGADRLPPGGREGVLHPVDELAHVRVYELLQNPRAELVADGVLPPTRLDGTGDPLVLGPRRVQLKTIPAFHQRPAQLGEVAEHAYTCFVFVGLAF